MHLTINATGYQGLLLSFKPKLYVAAMQSSNNGDYVKMEKLTWILLKHSYAGCYTPSFYGSDLEETLFLHLHKSSRPKS